MADINDLPFANPRDRGVELVNTDDGICQKVEVRLIPVGGGSEPPSIHGVHNTTGGFVTPAPAWHMQVYSELHDNYTGGSGVQTYNAVSMTNRTVSNDNNAEPLMDGQPMLTAHPGGVMVHNVGVVTVQNNVEITNIGSATCTLLEVRHRLNGSATDAGFARDFGVVAGLFVSRPLGSKAWDFLVTPNHFTDPDADPDPWFGIQIKVSFDASVSGFIARNWLSVTYHGSNPSQNADQGPFII